MTSNQVGQSLGASNLAVNRGAAITVVLLPKEFQKEAYCIAKSGQNEFASEWTEQGLVDKALEGL